MAQDNVIDEIVWVVGDDTLRLEPTVFRGKRNMRYIERARYYGTAGPAVGDELSAGQAKEYSVELSRGDYPWLWADKVSLAVERTKEGCCDVIHMQPVPVGSLMYVPAFAPVLAARQYRPRRRAGA
mgnify:CR=1 FL=1